jgi:hypothetical protein
MTGQRPSVVFTLVHGTFAQGAAWTKDGSPIREALRRGPCDSPAFLEFQWGGQNTNKARIAGGRVLAGHIRKVCVDYPNARHIIIAHSHGGNVALYALRDTPKPHPELITLATPFIHGNPRETEKFQFFILSILVYFICLITLLCILLIVELVVQGTVGAWLIGVCQTLTPGCDGLRPLKSPASQRAWDFIVSGIFAVCLIIVVRYLFSPANPIASAIIDAFSELFGRAVDISFRLTPELPPQASLLAIYVDADEPYGVLRFVDLLGGIPIRIVAWAISGLGAFFAFLPILGKASKVFYAFLRELSPHERNFIGIAVIALLLIFPFFCLGLSLLLVFVIVHRMGYWDEKLSEALLVELTVSSWPRVSYVREGDAIGSGGVCKYHFEKSLLWKFYGRLRHSHVYTEPRILNDIVAYVVNSVRPPEFRPFHYQKFDINLDPERDRFN